MNSSGGQALPMHACIIELGTRVEPSTAHTAAAIVLIMGTHRVIVMIFIFITSQRASAHSVFPACTRYMHAQESLAQQ